MPNSRPSEGHTLRSELQRSDLHVSLSAGSECKDHWSYCLQAALEEDSIFTLYSVGRGWRSYLQGDSWEEAGGLNVSCFRVERSLVSTSAGGVGRGRSLTFCRQRLWRLAVLSSAGGVCGGWRSYLLQAACVEAGGLSFCRLLGKRQTVLTSAGLV